MVMACFCAARPAIENRDSEMVQAAQRWRFTRRPLEIGMSENRAHQIVEQFRLGCHCALRIGVHVPRTQLVERGRLFVRQMEDVARAVAAARSNTALRTSGRCLAFFTALN